MIKPRCGPVRVGVANNLRSSRFFLSPKVGDLGIIFIWWWGGNLLVEVEACIFVEWNDVVFGKKRFFLLLGWGSWMKSHNQSQTWMFVSSKPLQSCLNCMSGALVWFFSLVCWIDHDASSSVLKRTFVECTPSQSQSLPWYPSYTSKTKMINGNK